MSPAVAAKPAGTLYAARRPRQMDGLRPRRPLRQGKHKPLSRQGFAMIARDDLGVIGPVRPFPRSATDPVAKAATSPDHADPGESPEWSPPNPRPTTEPNVRVTS